MLFEIEVAFGESLDNLKRVRPKETKVITGVDKERTLAGPHRGLRSAASEALDIRRRADAHEQVALSVLVNALLLVSGANVSRALAGPADVSEKGGNVVERVDAQAGVEGAGDERVAGAERGAENAEVLIALRFQPIEATADVEDGLAAGGNRAADVGAYRVVGAL